MADASQIQDLLPLMQRAWGVTPEEITDELRHLKAPYRALTLRMLKFVAIKRQEFELASEFRKLEKLALDESEREKRSEAARKANITRKRLAKA